MGYGRKVETRRDRKALARDAGMGRVSALSVLAGALCGLAVFQILVAVAGAVGVVIHGGTSFATTSDGQFKTAVGVILVGALFCSFMFGGYVSGRMSRRRGATHGLLAGVAGVVLAVGATGAVIRTGGDNGLARVARHIHVADSWHQWRHFGLVGVVAAATAMVLGGLAGAVQGERWHSKLLARAVDPTYGPEAEARAEAQKRMREAEVARLAGADHAGRLTGTAKAAGRPTVTSDPAVAQSSRPTVTSDTKARAGQAVGPDPTLTTTTTRPRHRKSRHLLGRR